jgi:7,8-dihydropterin-6-yl-methyl-4-(beta-D-ribofuranosyl)aminobenzene 5'-phosphate synthase
MTTKIICVVDNDTQKDTGLRSEHGLAFWIETSQGCVLFDTGQTAATLSHNLDSLDLKPQDADALALSHAHYDHTGGLEAILSKNAGIKIYAHSDLFQPRYSLREGEYCQIGLEITRADLTDRSELHLNDTPTEILPGLWTTGGISERPEPEGRSPHHFIRTNEGWQSDPYLDDMSLVLKISEGLVVICGCCHAGLLNTLFHVEREFNAPVIAILGGTHLVTADEPYLDHVIEVLHDRYKGLHFYLNHCTGKRAYQALRRVFSTRVKAYPAGTIVNFRNG